MSMGNLLAFVPNPLPPAIELTLPLVQTLSEADRSVGELAGIGRMMPNPHLFIRPFLRREAVLSSRIEGTITGLQELLVFETSNAPARAGDDVRVVYNYVEALEYGLHGLRACRSHSDSFASSTLLMRDVRGGDDHAGEYRRLQNFFKRGQPSIARIRFSPSGRTTGSDCNRSRSQRGSSNCSTRCSSSRRPR
jgi:hypothetical protein